MNKKFCLVLLAFFCAQTPAIAGGFKIGIGPFVFYEEPEKFTGKLPGPGGCIFYSPEVREKELEKEMRSSASSYVLELTRLSEGIEQVAGEEGLVAKTLKEVTQWQKALEESAWGPEFHKHYEELKRSYDQMRARFKPLAGAVMQKKAENRTSSDPQIVALQAERDARDALITYSGAVKKVNAAQDWVERVPDPLNIAWRDSALKEATDAQAAAALATEYAKTKRFEARLAAVETHYETLIAEMQAAHEQEIEMYRTVIAQLSARLGVTLSSSQPE